MGMNLSTKVGPYIKIIGNHIVTVTKTKKQCPLGHNKKQDGKFCNECGAEMINVPYEETKKRYPHQVLNDIDDIDDIDDMLYSPEGMDSILLPNDDPEDLIEANSDEHDECDLSDIDLNELKKSQIDWMGKTYTVAINVLMDAYGDDNVVIKWGIINYWS